AARMASSAEAGVAAPDSDGGSGASDTFRVWSAEPTDSIAAAKAVPFAERSELAAKIAAKQFVVSVEVNPPIGLDLTKVLAAARMLRAGGVDVVNIADGARAQARMGNLAMALRVHEKVGMETILHVCGRDRNLLATLAHLLGAHELGARNLVIITG